MTSLCQKMNVLQCCVWTVRMQKFIGFFKSSYCIHGILKLRKKSTYNVHHESDETGCYIIFEPGRLPLICLAVQNEFLCILIIFWQKPFVFQQQRLVPETSKLNKRNLSHAERQMNAFKDSWAACQTPSCPSPPFIERMRCKTVKSSLPTSALDDSHFAPFT